MMRIASLVLLLTLSIQFLAACGAKPNNFDADGLRDRSDQETDQVR
jgi:hypothetical protein